MGFKSKKQKIRLMILELGVRRHRFSLFTIGHDRDIKMQEIDI